MVGWVGLVGWLFVRLVSLCLYLGLAVIGIVVDWLSWLVLAAWFGLV